MISFNAQDGDRVQLRDETAHIFTEEDIGAVIAALGARRPLLLRGEPGCGKTQLAAAVAVQAGARFVSETLDALTGPRDLRWREDPVARLAEAQMAALSAKDLGVEASRQAVRRENFLAPGVLWWGFNWETAAALPCAEPPVQPHPMPPEAFSGVVVLIDEIDKAPPDVPEGLLEALGDRRFTPPNGEMVVGETWPLVVITSNNQRPLPNAFIRRCVVHDITLPADDEALVAWLMVRGAAHFPDMPDKALREAAEMVAADRAAALDDGWEPLPGQAEYIDLLRAGRNLSEAGRGGVLEVMSDLKRYIVSKRPPDRPSELR